jgi:predicted lipid-binding transport protein (Tim44 family)
VIFRVRSFNVFDIYTIIFLAVAVFIFLRLRRVLGQRTGRERHPYDLSSTHDAPRPSGNDNVVGVPGQGGASQDSSGPSEPPERWNAPAEEGSAAAAGLDGIAREDRSFDAKAFVAGARAAYEMIVTAYAEGDRRTLKNLLSREVYDGFKTAIQERESRGEKAETRFVSIDRSDIMGAEVRGRTAKITMRFVSQLVSVTRDGSGATVEGNPDKITEVTDVWTFARDVTSLDPNWKLVATQTV